MTKSQRLTAARATCFILAIAHLSGCASETVIRTVPAGADVFVNGQTVGPSPATYRIADDAWHPPYKYHVALEGYLPADGEFVPFPAVGRIIGAVFTLGIVAAFRPMYELEDSYLISLTPDPAASHAKPAPDRGTSLEEKLTELKQLHDEDKISDDDFRRQKARLLEEF
jgi:hypothetical protein